MVAFLNMKSQKEVLQTNETGQRNKRFIRDNASFQVARQKAGLGWTIAVSLLFLGLTIAGIVNSGVVTIWTLLFMALVIVTPVVRYRVLYQRTMQKYSMA